MVLSKRDLKRGVFRDGDEFLLPVRFVIKRLCAVDAAKVGECLQGRGSSWQSKKVSVYVQTLRSGTDPVDFPAIDLVLDAQGLFHISDGVSRLLACRLEKKRFVRATVRRDR